MSCKKFTKKSTCSQTFAICTKYEGTVPEEISSLSNEDCLSIEETTQDTYDILEEIKEDLNLEALRDGCITYDVEPIKLLDAFTNIQEFICNQAETIATMQINITTLQQQVADLQANNCP